jgi:hypothetical protein
MKVRLVTRDGEERTLDVDDRRADVRLEFPTRDGDPEFPVAVWLSELASLEVSEHPAPIVQSVEPLELERVTVSKAEAAGGRGGAPALLELDPRFAEPAYTYKRPKQPKPPAKKTAKARGAS